MRKEKVKKKNRQDGEEVEGKITARITANNGEKERMNEARRTKEEVRKGNRQDGIARSEKKDKEEP